MLGELLTQEVRFFCGPVKKELLPTPYVHPNHPTTPPIPSAIHYSQGFLHNNPFSNEEAAEESEARKKRRVQENRVENVSNGHHSPKQAQSPHSPAHATPAAAGSPRAATNGVGSNPSSPHSPPAKTGTSPTRLSPSEPAMVCLLCHRTLEGIGFVQCTSQTQHKFCLSCSRESSRASPRMSTAPVACVVWSQRAPLHVGSWNRISPQSLPLVALEKKSGIDKVAHTIFPLSLSLNLSTHSDTTAVVFQ